MFSVLRRWVVSNSRVPMWVVLDSCAYSQGRRVSTSRDVCLLLETLNLLHQKLRPLLRIWSGFSCSVQSCGRVVESNLQQNLLVVMEPRGTRVQVIKSPKPLVIAESFISTSEYSLVWSLQYILLWSQLQPTRGCGEMNSQWKEIVRCGACE